ncbi:MAG: hypothetical protein EON55_17985, partial [Alphaproteobacteria bacterium]
MNSLLYTPSVTMQHSTTNSVDSSVTTAIANGRPEALALSSSNINDNTRDGYSINQNLLWRHRTRRAGRTFTLGLT